MLGEHDHGVVGNLDIWMTWMHQLGHQLGAAADEVGLLSFTDGF